MYDEMKKFEIIEEIKKENTPTVYRIFRFNSTLDERWRYGCYLEGENEIKVHWCFSYSPTFYGFYQESSSFELQKHIEIEGAILRLSNHRLRNVTNPYMVTFRPLILSLILNESKTVTK